MTARDSITRARARTPGAEDYPTSTAAHDRALGPTQRGITDVVPACAKGGHKLQMSRCMPGAGLSWSSAGRCRPTCQPSSRIGENPPYGMIGRVEETSASFEARSAPRSYPTAGGARQLALLPRPWASAGPFCAGPTGSRPHPSCRSGFTPASDSDRVALDATSNADREPPEDKASARPLRFERSHREKGRLYADHAFGARSEDRHHW